MAVVGVIVLLRTVTTTSAVAAPPPAPVAVSVNVRSPPFFGLVNVGLAVVAPDRVAGGPPVCFHEYVLAPVVSEPSSVTATFWLTVWGLPAFTVGSDGLETTCTVTVLDCGPPAPVTVTTKVSVASPSAGTSGAVKVGWAAVESLGVTAGPPVCSQL